MPKSWTCQTCHAINDGRARFCSNCGAFAASQRSTERRPKVAPAAEPEPAIEPAQGPWPAELLAPVAVEPVEAGPISTRRRKMLQIGLIVVVVDVALVGLVLLWGSVQPPAAGTVSPAPTTVARATASPTPTSSQSPAPSPTTFLPDIKLHKIGERVEIAGLSRVTVVRAQSWDSDPDHPPAPGKRFIAVFIRIDSLRKDLSYDPYQFRAEDAAGGSAVPLSQGPTPDLFFSTILGKGDRREGYLAFSVPKGSKYRLEYRPFFEPGQAADPVFIDLSPIQTGALAPTTP